MTGSSPTPFVQRVSLHLRQLNLAPDDSALQKLEQFSKLLLKWNQKVHLVSRPDSNPERVSRQIVNSLLSLSYFEIGKGAKILDVGSGAGFPALPLKIVRPDLSFVLTESTRKKWLYLQKAISELKLEDVLALNERTENLPESYREYFDLATVKAVGSLAEVWEMIYPFLKLGGWLLAYKGQKLKPEMAKLEQLFKTTPGSVDSVREIDLNELNLGGYLVRVTKT
ncbi:MAG: 16S rRNA (guanine(527)-N(7))-methyltransferase RsmG [candidate division Zixibacteria bacterium]|nr:16S rRNA (guanine(527)-N(7))-methyltransferase RsmG [candidate division Zixibacteria bacterium]